METGRVVCVLVLFVLAAFLAAGHSDAVRGEPLTAREAVAMQKAETLNNEGKCQDAYRVLAPILMSHPDSFLPNYLMGAILHQSNSGVLAIRYYLQALRDTEGADSPIDNMAAARQDTYKQLFDIYTISLFFDGTETLLAKAEQECDEDFVTEVKANLATNRAAFEKISSPGPLTFKNAVCTLELPLPEGWKWLKRPAREEQYECSRRQLLKNKTLDIRAVIISAIPFDEGLEKADDRTAFLELMISAYGDQLKEQGHQLDKVVDGIVGGLKAKIVTSMIETGFLNLHNVTVWIPLKKGIVLMVIQHRNKKTAETIFGQCAETMNLSE